MEQDLLQPNHQQHFAVKHMAEIVTSWAEKRRKQYLALKVDAPFYALIQEQYPEALAFRRGPVCGGPACQAFSRLELDSHLKAQENPR